MPMQCWYYIDNIEAFDGQLGNALKIKHALAALFPVCVVPFV